MKRTLILMLTILTVSMINAQDTIYVSQSASGANDGTSWTNAYTNLQTAYTASISGDEVWVAAGTYLPGTFSSSNFALKTNVAMYGGFAGTETERTGVRDATISILSGDVDADNTWSAGDIEHIVVATESDSTAIIDGFTFQGGNSTLSYGAAITCFNGGTFGGGVSVNNCIFNRNFALYGGAIFIQSSAMAYMNFTNCIFSNNECSNYGGAIQNETAGYMKFINCTFYNNTATSSANAINDNTNSTSIDNCIIWNNGSVSDIFYNTPITNNSLIEGGFATGINILNVDPMFVDASNNDFRLLPCSPAIDAGDASGLSSYLNNYDLDFNERKVNTIDLGPYEYGIMNTLSVSGAVITTNASGSSYTYEWLNCDDNTIIAGNTTNTLTATGNGNFALIVTDNSCQTDTSACVNVNINVLVNSVVVNSQSGDSTITTLGGTLQMEADLLPLNADDMTYTWSLTSGTGTATLSTSGLLTASTDGTVTVTATANDASGTVGSKVITISNQSVGIFDNTYEALNVYPNPAQGFVNIDINENIDAIKIFDNTGKLVKTFIGNHTQIDVSDITKGLYLMQISNENKKSIVKLMIK